MSDVFRYSVLSLVLSCVPVDADDRPDVVLIVVDDLRPVLGCYGDVRVRTPNIDRLADQGIVFEHAYCQYAKCGTSRLSMLTGLRPDAVGVYSNNVRDVIRFRKRCPNVVPMPRWLKLHGYHTQSFGKVYHDGWDVEQDWSVPSTPGRDREMWEIVDQKQPASPTIIADRFDCPVIQKPDVPDSHLFAGRMTDQILRVLKAAKQPGPRFLAVGYRRPHLPFIAPRRYFEQYQPDDSWLVENPLPPSGSPVMAWFNSDSYVGAAKRIGLSMPLEPTRSQARDWNGYELRSYLGVPPRGAIDRSLQLQLLQAYAACVSYVDAQIGRLLAGIAASPRADRTIVILCSDHGWHLGEHSAWGKMTNFEVATRVPLLIAAPGFKPGRTPAIAELVDLYPTLCELTGIPSPEHLAGDSLVPVLNAPSKKSVHSTALSLYSRFRNRVLGTALRTERYRFVRWVDVASGAVLHRELYDHQTDPLEAKNLAGWNGYADIVRRLERTLPAGSRP